MIPVKQTKLHNPPEVKGNCFSASLASILEMGIDEVYDIYSDETSEWFDNLVEWAKSKGYQYNWVRGKEELPKDVYYIAFGKSPRFPDVLHCVVGLNGELIFDPHPDNKMLLGEPTLYQWLNKVKEG